MSLKGILYLTITTVCAFILGFIPNYALAQEWTSLKRGSDNIEVLGHLPLGGRLNVGDMDVDQDISRPYVYVGRMRYGTPGPTGMDIILSLIHI